MVRSVKFSFLKKLLSLSIQSATQFRNEGRAYPATFSIVRELARRRGDFAFFGKSHREGTVTGILMAFSAVSFVFFGLACLTSEAMFSEFSRYGLGRWRKTVGTFQLLGAAGLAAGFWLPWAGLAASGGLSLLMLLGVCVRVNIRDTLPQTLPALFYAALNAWLFVSLAVAAY